MVQGVVLEKLSVRTFVSIHQRARSSSGTVDAASVPRDLGGFQSDRGFAGSGQDQLVISSGRGEIQAEKTQSKR